MDSGTRRSENPAHEEKAVATKRRRNSVTRLIEDVVDDAKDLVDDVVDRARDVERDGRKAVRRAVKDRDDDDRSRNGSTRENELDDLKSALDDLTAKVNRLVAMQAETRKNGS